MSLLDSLITIFFLTSAFSGYRRGIVREVLVSSLWLPTLFTIGFIITRSITAEGELNTEATGLLPTLACLYLLGVIVICGIDAAFIRPRFKSDLHSTSRLFYKLTGLALALLRAWFTLVAGIALYSAYVSTPDEDIATHGLYMPHLAPTAADLRNWLEENGHIQHEELLYTDQPNSYQSEIDDAKQSLKNSFTQKWLGGSSEEDEE